MISRGIGAVRLTLTLGGLFMICVWTIALMTTRITPWGALIMTGLVVIICAREARTRTLLRVVFELGYRIGQRDRARDG